MTQGSGGSSRDLRDATHPDASSLHRSAVMLTGAADSADQLVRATLHRADRGSAGAGGDRAHSAVRGDDPDLLAALVREYLRHSSRRQVDRVVPVGTTRDAGELLDSLRPRQRAAAVLMLIEGWSAQQTARVLGLPPERMSSLLPRTVGLADALRALAYHHQEPPSAADRRPPAVRRSAAAVVLLVLTVVVGLLGQDDGSREPVVDGGPDDSAASSGDLAGRGWVLGPRGDPPAFLEGLRLIHVSILDYADPARSLTLDTLPRKGRAVFAALWCDMPPRDPNLVLPTMTLRVAGHTVALPCAGKHDDPPVRRLLPLPPPEQPGRVPVTLGWEGDLPGRGSAVLATYTEFGQNEPPRTPLAVPDPLPSVREGAAVLDSDHVPTQVDGGDLLAQRVRVSSRTRLSIWSGGTGRFTILVDGIIVSDDGDLRQDQQMPRSPELWWQDQDPQLRDGSWTIHAPGQTTQFPLPTVVRPAPGQEREVTLQVLVAPGSTARWQVQASHASAVAAGRDRPVPPGHRGGDGSAPR